MGQNELNTILSYVDEKFNLHFRKIIAYIRPNEDEMTERQAFDEFGRGFVEWCLSMNYIVPLRAGKHKNSRKVYSRFLLTEIKIKKMDEDLRRIARDDTGRPRASCS